MTYVLRVRFPLEDDSYTDDDEWDGEMRYGRWKTEGKFEFVTSLANYIQEVYGNCDPANQPEYSVELSTKPGVKV